VDKKKLDRYEGLFACLEDMMAEQRQDITFLEVGTYNGKRAADLCTYWREQTEGKFTYIGFDLFEDMTPEMNKAELSKSTLPPAKAAAEATLKRAGANVLALIKGNTRETIPAFVEVLHGSVIPDLIFVDGGHSLETIDSDWAALSNLVGPKTYVVFDDYYENKDDYGCKQLITRLAADPAFKVELLTPVDRPISTGLHIRMALVKLKKAASLKKVA